jgi:hypothetical protein
MKNPTPSPARIDRAWKVLDTMGLKPHQLDRDPQRKWVKNKPKEEVLDLAREKLADLGVKPHQLWR